MKERKDIALPGVSAHPFRSRDSWRLADILSYMQWRTPCNIADHSKPAFRWPPYTVCTWFKVCQYQRYAACREIGL